MEFWFTGIAGPIENRLTELRVYLIDFGYSYEIGKPLPDELQFVPYAFGDPQRIQERAGNNHHVMDWYALSCIATDLVEFDLPRDNLTVQDILRELERLTENLPFLRAVN